MAVVERVHEEALALLDDYRDLTDVQLRRRVETAEGFFMAESEKVIRRAVLAGYRPRSVLTNERWLPAIVELLRDIDAVIYLADDQLIQQVAGYRVHRGALASMHRPDLPSVAEVVADARLVVVLEDLVDHTNVGAIFRAAAGLGADAVLVSPRCADPLYRRSVRVSMGTVLQVPWTRMPEWPEARRILDAAGFHVAALALDERAVSLDEFAADPPDRIALTLGAEGDGLSSQALAAADSTVMIPMFHGVDSLNVASASAVALWAVRTKPTHTPA